jgi:hypothetical protein
MRAFSILGAAVLAAQVGWMASPAQAKPHEPKVFATPQVPEGGESEFVVDVGAEYRARLIYVSPLELSGTAARDVGWTEQRLRIDGSFSRSGLGSIFIQADVLDGVLFGDNGVFGRSPAPTSGMGITSKQPNLSAWQVGLLPGGDPLNADDYGPVLRAVEPVRINYAYGEVLLPFGVLRVGRMPTSDNGTVSINDGRSGRNLWGASWYHESSDRILFGTKLSEVWRMIDLGKDYVADRSRDEGLFIGFVYDLLVEDEVYDASDDMVQFATQLDLKLKDFQLLGLDWQKLRLTATLNHRWDDRFNTRIWAIPMQLTFDVGAVSLDAQVTVVTGKTRELATGFAELTGREVVDQDVHYVSSRVQLFGRLGPVTLLGEWAYASGDDDPRSETPLNIGNWPRDTNLGLLLYEHIVAFQSARSAAVGIKNLEQLEAESFPVSELATDGRATNVNAFFPQVFIDALDTKGHDLRFKVGALFAWSQVPVTDSLMTILNWDGDRIDDDAVNFHGGKPGDYWGTELDFGVEYRYQSFFELAIEAAVLLPGNGLQDENGDAVTSWMVETRFQFNL